jgi:hypothetical protein
LLQEGKCGSRSAASTDSSPGPALQQHWQLLLPQLLHWHFPGAASTAAATTADNAAPAKQQPAARRQLLLVLHQQQGRHRTGALPRLEPIGSSLVQLQLPVNCHELPGHVVQPAEQLQGVPTLVSLAAACPQRVI